MKNLPSDIEPGRDDGPETTADEQLVHGLLRFTREDSPQVQRERVRRVMAAIDTTSEPAVVRQRPRWRLVASVAACLVGVVTLLLTPDGFVGVAHPDSRFVRLNSFYLLLAGIVAFVASLYFRGNTILAGTVPFIALAVVHKTLAFRLSNNSVTQNVA